MLDTIAGRSLPVRRLQKSLATAVWRSGLGANGATVGGAATGVLAGCAFARGATAVAIALLLLSALFDAVDGTLAREFAKPTIFGGVLDLSADRIVESAAIIGIAWRRPELYLAALVLVSSWYINIAVFLATGAALAQGAEKLIEYPPGLVERTEAIIFLVVLALSRRLGPPLCYAYAALEVITAAQRLMFARRTLPHEA